MKKRGGFFSSFVFGWIGLLFSSASVAASSSSAQLKTFAFRLPGEPETLDWNLAHTPIETYLLMNLMEGLVEIDSQLRVVPSLAESWTISPDGRTYTFKLKPGVKWSDGVPLRAEHFVYSWKRLLSPTTAAPYAYFLFDVEGAETFHKGLTQDFSKVGVQALDPLTLQVRLVRRLAHWIYVPSFWVTFPLREDIVRKHGSAWPKPGRMVTVGPFSLSSHDFDSKVTLQANPYYHGRRGNVEQVIGRIVGDDSTALSLYEAGKLDFLTDISILDLKNLSGRADLKSFPYLKTGYLGFATDKYPVSDARVRRAIAMAIDRSRIGEILHGGQQAASSFAPPKMLAYDPKAGFAYDPVRAKQELKAAGLDPSRPLKLELLIPNWDKQRTMAQYIQAQLMTNLGIQVTIQAFDNKMFRAQQDLRAFPFFSGSWSADFPDPDNFFSVFLSTSGNNRTGWKNEKYDQAVLTARGGDAKSRKKSYAEAQRLLLEQDVVIIPLYYEPNMALVRSRVRGIELNPMNSLLLRKVNVE